MWELERVPFQLYHQVCRIAVHGIIERPGIDFSGKLVTSAVYLKHWMTLLATQFWNVFTDKISNLVTKSYIERIRNSWASIKHWNHCLVLSKIWYLLMLCHHGQLVKYCYSISDVWSKSLRHTGIFFQLILFLIFNIIITMKGEKEQSELSNNYTFHQSSFDHLSFWLYLTTWWLRLWPNRITQRTVCHATTKRIH